MITDDSQDAMLAYLEALARGQVIEKPDHWLRHVEARIRNKRRQAEARRRWTLQTVEWPRSVAPSQLNRVIALQELERIGVTMTDARKLDAPVRREDVQGRTIRRRARRRLLGTSGH